MKNIRFSLFLLGTLSCALFFPALGMQNNKRPREETAQSQEAPAAKKPKLLSKEEVKKIITQKFTTAGQTNIDTVRLARLLQEAISKGYADIVAQIIQEKLFDVNIKNEQGATILHHLTTIQNDLGLDAIQFLINQGVDINALTKTSATPLICATASGNYKIAELLITHGASVTAINNSGRTALQYAIKYKHSKITKLLLDHSAITLTDKKILHILCHPEAYAQEVPASSLITPKKPTTPDTIIIEANTNKNKKKISQTKRELNKKQSKAIEKLQTMCPSLAITTKNQLLLLATQLEATLDLGCEAAVDTLIESQILNLFVVDEEQNSLLHAAITIDAQRLIHYLITKETHINAVNNTLKTPLHLACQDCYRHIETIKALLSHGAATCTKDLYGNIPLSYVWGLGAASILLQAKDIVKDTNVLTDTFYSLVQANNCDIAQLIIDTYPDKIMFTNKTDKSLPLLCFAVQNNHPQLAAWLLVNGINPSQEMEFFDGNERITPIYRASWNGNVAIVELLLSFGAAINSEAFSPLHAATSNGHDKVVALLLAYKANVNARNSIEATPLYYAVKYGHQKIAKMLIDAGAQSHIYTQNGETPLQAAAENGDETMITLLLDAGAVITPNAIESAVKNSKESVAYEIITRDPEIHAGSYRSREHLRNAIQNGLFKISEWLINLFIKNKWSVPTDLIITAAENGNSKVVQLLLNKKINNVHEKIGADDNTLCHLSAQKNHPSVISVLIAHGADINTKNKYGMAPLATAMLRKSTESVIFLLENDATMSTNGEKEEVRLREELSLVSAAIGTEQNSLILSSLIAHGVELFETDFSKYRVVRSHRQEGEKIKTIGMICKDFDTQRIQPGLIDNVASLAALQNLLINNQVALFEKNLENIRKTTTSDQNKLKKLKTNNKRKAKELEKKLKKTVTKEFVVALILRTFDTQLFHRLWQHEDTRADIQKYAPVFGSGKRVAMYHQQHQNILESNFNATTLEPKYSTNQLAVFNFLA